MKSPHEGKKNQISVSPFVMMVFFQPNSLWPSIRGFVKLLFTVSQVRRLHSTLWVAIIWKHNS
jgi:hypothetical protein